MAWEGPDGVVETRAERVCRSGCPGERECGCGCHDAADRVRALLEERFGAGLESERVGGAA